MRKIGIIVNPFSGKDLRRITTQASSVGNHEKMIKTNRMIRCLDELGIDRVYLMPDNCLLNASIAAKYQSVKSGLRVEVLDFIPTDRPEDTETAVKMMVALAVKCIIVLGGDGTSRLVAKFSQNIPIIPLSTGTNNVYPEFWEGTTVAVAAAYLTITGMKSNLIQDKCVQLYVNDHYRDLALIDAAITSIPYVGSKIVAQISDITEVIVSRCSPFNIGFSALIGSVRICHDCDNFGYRMKLHGQSNMHILTPVNSGGLLAVTYSELEPMAIDQSYQVKPGFFGTVALDGERTVAFREGDQLRFKITKNGPLRVDIKNTLFEAIDNGFLQLDE